MKYKLLATLFFLISSISFGDSISFDFENDLFQNQDFYYTDGVKLTYQHNNWEYGIAQNMYTPAIKTTLIPLEGDRPYAGWLYGSIANSSTIHIDNIPFEQFIELDVGMVGPDSFAYQTQATIHRMIGDTIPKGWNSQVPNTLGTTLLAQESKPLFTSSASQYFNIIPYGETCVGNVMDYVKVGADAELGYNVESCLHNQINVKLNRNSNINRLFFFTGVNEKYLFQNMFLEGYDHYPYAVDIEDMVGNLEFGATIQFQSVKLSWIRDYSTKEFTTEQENRKGYDVIKLTVEF